MTEHSLQNRSRLVLGTAQIGMRYGIANRTGKPDLNVVKKMLSLAWEGGIREFDTAQAYGESESVLGNVLTELGIESEVRVITKLAPGLLGASSDMILHSIRESCVRLNVQKLYGVLIHDEDALYDPDNSLCRTLAMGVDEGLMEKVGVSVCSPDAGMKAVNNDHIELIQIPSNVFDYRFARVGMYEAARKMKKSVYIRSVFLQGLLFMRAKDLPPHMRYAAGTLGKFERYLSRKGWTAGQVALNMILQTYPNARIVIGAESVEQISQNLSCVDGKMPTLNLRELQEMFSEVDESIVNPTRWPHECKK